MRLVLGKPTVRVFVPLVFTGNSPGKAPLPVNVPVPNRFWLSGLSGIPRAANSAWASTRLTAQLPTPVVWQKAGLGEPSIKAGWFGELTVEGVSIGLELLTRARIPS